MTEQPEPNGLTVGQTVVISRETGNHRDLATEHTVVSIGRKYAKLSGDYKVTLATMRAVDHDLARCWPSVAAYQAGKARDKAWTQLRAICTAWKAPDGIATETLDEAIRLLRPPVVETKGND